MSTTFEEARVGDTLWSCDFGYVPVVLHELYSSITFITGAVPYLKIEFKGNKYQFSMDGRLYDYKTNRTGKDGYMPQRTLFWSEIKIIPPLRPPRMIKKTMESWIYEWPDGYRVSSLQQMNYSTKPKEFYLKGLFDVEEE